ncbi:LPXTG cell wall anchor domain-containing protein [Asanoa sp. NPDC050611]|uniref:LPXTG cell wall anchor domain-containing protein n=1 Tax=Asanoa sp. NPDC050611 TaxID=3157098 RepID=UPI0033ED674C
MTLLRTAIVTGAAALTLALSAGPARAIELTGVSVAGTAATVSGGAARPGATVVVTAATGSGPEIDVVTCGATATAAGTWSCLLTGLRPASWTVSASDHVAATPLRGFQVGSGGPPADPPELATTGGSVNLPLAAAGAALLAVGAGLRRRSRVPKAQ